MRIKREMSTSTTGHESTEMDLESLSGATLKYETADGETVVVEFDE